MNSAMDRDGYSILIFADAANIYRRLSLQKEKIGIVTLSGPPDRGAVSRAELAVIDSGWKAARGLKVLKAVKAINPRLLVIFLTDAGSEELAVEAFRKGARDYWRKPFSIPDLEDMIRGLLRLRRAGLDKREAFVPGRSSEPWKLSVSFGKSPVPSWLPRVLRFIEGYPEGGMSLSACAERANLSKFHFERQFKKLVGMTPLQYFNFIRTGRAKNLLEFEDTTTLEAALASGFSDYSQFFRTFKKIVGASPMAYRRLARSRRARKPKIPGGR